MPPDESAGNQNNSAYTNAAVSKSLSFGIEVASLLNISIPSNWSSIAANLRIPFDTVHQRHLEYDNYTNENITQADVALLQYPLHWTMSAQIAVNDLTYYQSVTNTNGFFTGDSAYSIAWLRQGQLQNAQMQFATSFSHIRQPFFVWNEQIVGGHSHFITGAGEFLQNVLFGYGGLRLTKAALLIVNPQLPPGNATAVSFRNLAYRGRTFHLQFDNSTISFTLTSADLPTTPAGAAPYLILNDSTGTLYGLEFQKTLTFWLSGAENFSVIASSSQGPVPSSWKTRMLYFIILGVCGAVLAFGLIALIIVHFSKRNDYVQLQ